MRIYTKSADIRDALWKAKDAIGRKGTEKLRVPLAKVYHELGVELRHSLSVAKQKDEGASTAERDKLIDAIKFDVAQWADKVMDNMDEPFDDVTKDAIKQALQEVDLTTEDISNADEITDKIIEAMTDKVSTEPLKTFRDDLEETIKRDYAQGLSVEDMSAHLQDKIDGLSDWKALQVAQTTSTPTVNMAQTEAWRASKKVGKKEWLTMRDSKVRDAHRELDGQIKGLDEPFTWHGQTAMEPGLFADAGMSINCRCYKRAVMDIKRLAVFQDGTIRYYFA